MMDSQHVARHMHALVSGKVQGVFYRKFVRNEARRLGLVGMVRNLPDGRVELEAEGPEPSLHELVRQLYVGPPGARVESVRSDWSEPTGDAFDFAVESR